MFRSLCRRDNIYDWHSRWPLWYFERSSLLLESFLSFILNQAERRERPWTLRDASFWSQVGEACPVLHSRPSLPGRPHLLLSGYKIVYLLVVHTALGLRRGNISNPTRIHKRHCILNASQGYILLYWSRGTNGDTLPFYRAFQLWYHRLVY